MTDQVEVWLDADFLACTRVGTLTHDRGTLRFVYQPEWLKNSQAFALDPNLSCTGCGHASKRVHAMLQFPAKRSSTVANTRYSYPLPRAFVTQLS